jgi:hypothetical protein
MFKSLINWTNNFSTNFSNTASSNEWATWHSWQLNQPPSHFKNCVIFDYYLSHRLNWYPPSNSVCNTCFSQYYQYCFGDYSILIVQPTNGSNAIDYFTLLLDLYDICKGTTRRLTGDPPGIKVLRETITFKNLDPLSNHNFEPYSYDYGTLHAHTVVQFSLSTLIMRLVSHYLSQINEKKTFPNITLAICSKAYTNKVFGDYTVINKSTPISINQTITTTNSVSSSWPSNYIRCEKCHRITENIWGPWKVCIDCHLKRICSECGNPAVIIGGDNFPKCCEHQ